MIARILRSVVAESLLEVLAFWINEQRTTQNKPIIAFNGTTVLRGSYRNDRKRALQLVRGTPLSDFLIFKVDWAEIPKGTVLSCTIIINLDIFKDRLAYLVSRHDRIVLDRFNFH